MTQTKFITIVLDLVLKFHFLFLGKGYLYIGSMRLLIKKNPVYFIYYKGKRSCLDTWNKSLISQEKSHKTKQTSIICTKYCDKYCDTQTVTFYLKKDEWLALKQVTFLFDRQRLHCAWFMLSDLSQNVKLDQWLTATIIFFYICQHVIFSRHFFLDDWVKVDVYNKVSQLKIGLLNHILLETKSNKKCISLILNTWSK